MSCRHSSHQGKGSHRSGDYGGDNEVCEDDGDGCDGDDCDCMMVMMVMALMVQILLLEKSKVCLKAFGSQSKADFGYALQAKVVLVILLC